MNRPIKFNQNDAGILLTLFCRDETGAPIDITPFTVDFMLYHQDTLINSERTACTIADAAMGIAEYTVDAADTTSIGLFQGKIKLQNGSTEVRNIGGIPVQVCEV